MSTRYFDSRREEEQGGHARLRNCLMRVSQALEGNSSIQRVRTSFGLRGIASLQRAFDPLEFGRNRLDFCLLLFQLASLRLCLTPNA